LNIETISFAVAARSRRGLQPTGKNEDAGSGL